jgi:hypothetical protein
MIAPHKPNSVNVAYAPSGVKENPGSDMLDVRTGASIVAFSMIRVISTSEQYQCPGDDDPDRQDIV